MVLASVGRHDMRRFTLEDQWQLFKGTYKRLHNNCFEDLAGLERVHSCEHAWRSIKLSIIQCVVLHKMDSICMRIAATSNKFSKS